MDSPTSLPQFRSHSRHWRENLYVYPVISRRSGGLSIGINLNPDTACNFDCIYCQVDRGGAPRAREVDLDALRAELTAMIALAASGELFEDPAFDDVPLRLRRLHDIAFSGDGEPTTCPVFRQAVELAVEVKKQAGLDEVKLILITDACYLTRPEVKAGLTVLDENQGEIWAKLDAGTEAYYRLINRPNYPLAHVMSNIVDAARARPVVIQSLFMRVRGAGPDTAEIAAYVERLRDIVRGGGKIKLVQVYTVARRPAEDYVTPLSDAEVDAVVEAARQGTGLTVEGYYAGR